jgi:hypothetical protein
MLFDLTQPKDDSPIERLNITYVQLFYGDKDMTLFKRMCKDGMVKMWPNDYQQRNLSEYIFELVKQANENTAIATTHDSPAS